jgi:hypothetical protein
MENLKNLFDLVMKKKILLVYGVLILTIIVLAFLTFGPKTVIQKATGATAAQGAKIKAELEKLNLKCVKLSKSTSPFVEGMDPNWHAFDMIGNDNKKYILVLQRSNNSLTAVLDEKGSILAGLIDNGIAPGLFKNRGY